jgi:methyl halide transferase
MSGPNWEDLYQRAETPWDKGESAPGLVDFLAAHGLGIGGHVAIPGCGYGHDVRAWVGAGCHATGFDLSATATARAQERTPDGRAKFCVGDFLADAPPSRFDWLFEHTLFCAIQPDQRDRYVRAVERWLPAGGQFLAVHYFRPSSPEGPPFPVDRVEILSRFTGAFELLAEWVPRSFNGREGRERMFWWRRCGAKRARRNGKLSLT